MLKLTKYIVVELVSAFLMGIGGYVVFFYLSSFMKIDYFFNIAGDKTDFIIGMLIGFPIGASLGIFISKKYLLRLGNHYMICFMASLLCTLILAFLTGRYFFPLLVEIFNLGSGLDVIFLILIPIYALIGDMLPKLFFNKNETVAL